MKNPKLDSTDGLLPGDFCIFQNNDDSSWIIGEVQSIIDAVTLRVWFYGCSNKNPKGPWKKAWVRHNDNQIVVANYRLRSNVAKPRINDVPIGDILIAQVLLEKGILGSNVLQQVDSIMNSV